MDPIPTVSVVVPTYDRLSLLQRALDSVLSQEGVVFEVIVVDDGSTDGTAAWLATIDDPRVRHRSIPNGGVAAARNLAIRDARAPWIALLDDDNEWFPGYLESQLATAARHPEAGVVYSAHLRRSPGQPDERRRVLPPRTPAAAALAAGWFPMMSACVIRRDLLLDQPFRPDLPVAEDFEVLFHLAHRTPFVGNAGVLVLCHQHTGPRLTDGMARWAAAHERIDRELGPTVRRELGWRVYERWVRRRVVEPHLVIMFESMDADGRDAARRAMRALMPHLPWSARALARPAVAFVIGPRGFRVLRTARRKQRR